MDGRGMDGFPAVLQIQGDQTWPQLPTAGDLGANQRAETEIFTQKWYSLCLRSLLSRVFGKPRELPPCRYSQSSA